MAAHNCCNNYTRSQLMRNGRGPGRQGPAGDRDRDARCRRAPGSRAARSSRAARASRSRSTARRRSRSQAFEEGIAHADTNGNVLVSIFFDGGIDSMSLLAPTGHPQYAGLRPTLALAPTEGTAFSEDPTPALASRPRSPLATPARRGQGLGLPGDRLHEPEPVPLHLAALLRDRRARGRRPHRLARAATSTARAPTTTRCRASRSTAASPPRSRPPTSRSRRSSDPTDFDMWTRGHRRLGRARRCSRPSGNFGELPGPGELGAHDPGAARHGPDRTSCASSSSELRRLPDPAGLPEHELRAQARRARRADRRAACR